MDIEDAKIGVWPNVAIDPATGERYGGWGTARRVRRALERDGEGIHPLSALRGEFGWEGMRGDAVVGALAGEFEAEAAALDRIGRVLAEFAEAWMGCDGRADAELALIQLAARRILEAARW